MTTRTCTTIEGMGLITRTGDRATLTTGKETLTTDRETLTTGREEVMETPTTEEAMEMMGVTIFRLVFIC